MASLFAQTARTQRVPIVLLTLLVATLLFPGACDEARVALSSWLPATAGSDAAPTASLPAEERARLLHEIERLRQEIAAGPTADGVLAGIAPGRRRSPPAVDPLPARVLHREITSARRTFVIDAGRDDGVIPGHPVVQQDSLLGIVVTSAANAARVLRIDDRAALVSLPAVVLAAEAAETGPCRGTGIARGTGDGRVRLTHLPSGGARVGDLVVTGAGSRLVPEGLLIGEVVECGDADRDGDFDAVVRPLRDLDTAAAVRVLRSRAPGLRIDAR